MREFRPLAQAEQARPDEMPQLRRQLRQPPTKRQIRLANRREKPFAIDSAGPPENNSALYARPFTPCSEEIHENEPLARADARRRSAGGRLRLRQRRTRQTCCTDRCGTG